MSEKNVVVGINATKDDLKNMLKRRRVDFKSRALLSELETLFIDYCVAQVEEQKQLKIARNKRRNKKRKAQVQA